MYEVMTTNIYKMCDSESVVEKQVFSILSNSANKFNYSWLNPKTSSLGFWSPNTTCKAVSHKLQAYIQSASEI